MPNRVAHFEIHADDPERAITFYSNVFGWDFQQWESAPSDYWMVMTGKREEPGGINGGLMKRKGSGPIEGAAVNGYVCTMVVDAYDDIHTKILANGGTIALPKTAIPGMAWQGYYKDPEGNIFGIHQPDKNGA